MLKVKKNLKTKFYKDKEMQDNMKEFYLIKRKLIIWHIFITSVLFLFQPNFIVSQLSSVQKGIWDQSQEIAHFNKKNKKLKIHSRVMLHKVFVFFILFFILVIHIFEIY